MVSPRRLVMSQLQIWLGPVASSSGFGYAVPELVAPLGDGQDPDFLLDPCTRPRGRGTATASTVIRSRSRGVWNPSQGAPDEGVRGSRARTYWGLGPRTG